MSKNAIMKYFAYSHLPEKLQAVSKPIGDLAKQLDELLPDGAEKSAGLRKLLEAKDCFVRQALEPESYEEKLRRDPPFVNIGAGA